jgi:hypothetical protein
MAIRISVADMTVKLQFNPFRMDGVYFRKKEMWPPFKEDFGENFIRKLHMSTQFAFSDSVTILLSCQQLCF